MDPPRNYLQAFLVFLALTGCVTKEKPEATPHASGAGPDENASAKERRSSPEISPPVSAPLPSSEKHVNPGSSRPSSAAPVSSVAPTLSFSEAKARGLKIRQWPGVDYHGPTPLESYLGILGVASVTSWGPLSPDKELVASLQAIADELGAASHRPRIGYKVYLIETPMSNAVSVGDGNIFVTRGLLDDLNSEDRVAAAIAHEIGHVCGRHRVKKIQKQEEINFYSKIAKGVVAGSIDQPDIRNIVVGATGEAFQLLNYRYSREEEHEADQLGAIYLARAGYDPRALLEVLQIFARQEGTNKNALDAMHPHPLERLQQVQLFIAAGLPDNLGHPTPLPSAIHTPDHPLLEADGAHMGSAASLSSSPSISRSVRQEPQHAATWKSLTPCSSTLDDASRILGSPLGSVPTRQQSIRQHFKLEGKDVFITSEESMIRMIEIHPDVVLNAESLRAAYGSPGKEQLDDDFHRSWAYGDGRLYYFRKDGETVERVVYTCPAPSASRPTVSGLPPPPFTAEGTPWYNFGPPDPIAMTRLVGSGILKLFGKKSEAEE